MDAAKQGRHTPTEIALLPISAYYPASFQKTHMVPDESHQRFLGPNAK